MHEYSSKPAFETLDDIKDKKVTVMGLGLNGGGIASTRFFARHGAYVTVTDMKSEEELAPSINELMNDFTIDKSKIRFVLGKHELSDFSDADVVIKNPGVKYEGNKYLAAAKAIETDLSIFLHFTKAPVIAVTGSKGKSSTVSAIHYGLCQAGFNAFLGGNITVSPLTFLLETDEKTPVVLELSSWQLSDLRGRKLLKPFISVLTTIVPDHQNWYGGMEPYVADKKLIYKDQDKKCFTLCKYNDEWGKVFASETEGNVIWYDVSGNRPDNFEGCYLDENGCGYFSKDSSCEKILSEKLSVPGNHMRENVLKAAAVLKLMNVDSEKIASIMETYPGISHRLEYFHEWENRNKKKIRFYNDSAATVPEACAAAISSFDKDICLICGGTDKNLVFEPLAEKIDIPKEVYLLKGTGTDKLLKTISDRNISYEGPFDSLSSLLDMLKEKVNSEIVVFSPGATSFGMFKNEFDRGNTFKKLVKEKF